MEINEKFCKKCNTIKNVDSFYKDKNLKSGLRNHCKDCANKMTKGSRKRIFYPVILEYKCCSECKELKRTLDFQVTPNVKDGLSNKCQVCINKYALELYHKNKDKISDKRKTKEVREIYNLWRTKNKDKINKLNRERRKTDEYRLKRKVNEQNREGRKRANGGKGIKIKEWKEVLNTFDNICIKCGAGNPTMDHIIPVAKGGKHEIENVQPLCITCNVKKQVNIIDYRPNYLFHEEVFERVV